MVALIKYYACDRCGKQHPTYDDARDCELGHITDKAIEGFKRDLANIFPRKGKST